MRSAEASLLAAAVLVSGCYTYRPLPTPEPVAGTRVSAELTDEGTRDLSGEVGPDVQHVEGQVLEVDSTRVDLAVYQVENIRGIQTYWKGERVTLPRQVVAGWQQRRLSVGGTGLMGGLVLGSLYAAYRLLGGAGILEGRGTGGGGGAN